MTLLHDVYSGEHKNHVLQKLQTDNPELWVKPPRYTDYSRRESLQKLDELEHAIAVTGHPEDESFYRAATVTRAFVERAFDEYEADEHPLKGAIDRVFAVSTRTTRGDERYASEVAPYIPLALPQFGSNSDIRQRMFAGLPPMTVDTYTQSGDKARQGAVVLTPFFADMLMGDLAQNDVLPTIAENIDNMARFSHDTLGARMMGLGAWLPRLTDLGRAINVEGMTTTTGHAGTVHLIAETTHKVMDDWGIADNATVGVLGGVGSIGLSSIQVLKANKPALHVIAYDTREDVLARKSRDTGLFSPTEDTRELLESSEVIIAAVIDEIDLDKIDPDMEIDLSGKVIIDDSQPAGFTREQVEARGGTLVWVVGKDESNDGFIARDGGLNYGDEAGIWGSRAVWGCEAEVAVLAAEGKGGEQLAIRERVRPDHAHKMGELFMRHNVEVADYQSYGTPVMRSVGSQ